jgi:hypothetical protein
MYTQPQSSMCLVFTSHDILWLCALALIWTPRVTCAKRHVSWVCHVPWRTHTQPTCRGPLWTQCTHPSPCAHQLTCMLDRRAPSLDARPLPRALPCVNRRDSLCVCRWGCPTSLVCPCCQGQMGPLLGHAPKLPRPCPNTTQVSVIRRKGRRVCAPLGLHVTIVLQGAPAHTQMSLFAQLIVSSLCSSSVLSPNLPKERARLVGVPEGLTSSFL